MDVKRGAKLKEIVAVSYHTLDAYGFHALEMVQCLVERRAGGETGVKQARCLSGDAVWRAMDQGMFDRKLLDAALKRLKRSPITRQPKRPLRELAKSPDMFVIEYRDGLKAAVAMVNGIGNQFGSALKLRGTAKPLVDSWSRKSVAICQHCCTAVVRRARSV